MKRIGDKTKYFYNSSKAYKGFLYSQGYKITLDQDKDYGHFVYHYYEKTVNRAILESLDIRTKYPEEQVEEWSQLWGYKPDEEEYKEIGYTFHIFPEIKNKLGEYEVIAVLGEDVELKKSD